MLRKLLFLCLPLFAGCNSGETAHTRNAEADKHHAALSLNNGVKWVADENTRIHAAKLNAQIAAFNKQQSPAQEEYQALASEMQNELNGLINDCKMKGAEHDVFHSWLEPVHERVKKLEKTESASQGADIVRELTMQIRKFNQYFN